MHNPPAVEVKDLVFHYGANKAVDGISLTIQEGTAVALLGPNGAGKSTLINCLLGLSAPQQGTVHIRGLSPAVAAGRGQFGVMMQGADLPQHARVEELLRFLARLYPRGLPLAQAVARAEIPHLLRKMTDRLSGGERRRVQFAAALVANPPLWVLDEPTEGMDLESRTRFWDTVRDLHPSGSRHTVLFATHELSEADRFADLVVLMAKGRVVAADTPFGLKSNVARATVRFCADPSVDVQELARKLGGDHAEPVAASRWAVSVLDGDRAARVLTRTAEVSELEIMRGSLDDVFRTLLES